METEFHEVQNEYLAQARNILPWFRNTVIDGLQPPVMLELKQGPRTETSINNVVGVWIIACWRMWSGWGDIDVPSISHGFELLLNQSREFPTIPDFHMIMFGSADSGHRGLLQNEGRYPTRVAL